MKTVYVKVQLKPTGVLPSKPISSTVPKGRGKQGKIVPGHPGDVPAPVFAVRTVQAEDLGHACRAAEAMPDVLACVETSYKSIS
jgi:hypothetical protein